MSACAFCAREGGWSRRTFSPDTHAVLTFRAETSGERAVTVKVLIERTALDGDKAVGGEGTGQDCDVAESRLGRFIEDVCEHRSKNVSEPTMQTWCDRLRTRHLVLKVLRRNERTDERCTVSLGFGFRGDEMVQTHLSSLRPPFPSMA